MNPTNPSTEQPTAWRRISHFLAETGLGRDAFLGACKAGDLDIEVRKIGHLYYARPRRAEPTLAERIYGERERWRAPVDDTEYQSTIQGRVYAARAGS